MDNDRGIPKTGIPFAVQMVREKIEALRVMPTREEIQKLLAIRMQTGAGLAEFTHSHNLHKIISTHLLIMEVDFCPVLCTPEVPVLQAFQGIGHFVWYCKAVSDLS